MATTTFPTDQQLPNTNKIIRQTDCQYSFGKEAISLTLKFMGDTKEAVSLASNYRSGTRVKVSDLTSKFTELNGILPTTQLEATGRVTASVSSTKTGSGSVSITVQVPYKAKISIGGSGGDDPKKRVIVTWSEKSTDYEFPLEIYAGDSDSASEANAGDFEGWKNEKTRNIENYKTFKYTKEGKDEPVELEGRTRELAEKWYRGIESVRRAYPEVIRTTQYLNLKADKDEVDETLIKQIDPKTSAVKLYYRNQTPNAIWKGKFPNFDWLYASYDVNTEVTEYQRLWNVTVSESWIGIDKDERGTWDDDLYGPDGTRWKFAGVNGVQPSGNYDDDTPIEPEDVSGKGRVKPDTFTDQSSIKDIDLGGDFHAVDSNSFRAASTRGLRLLAATATPGAPALESIKMPSVSFIGNDAFNGAANLQSIVLSNQISFLGESVFKDCSAMTEAIVEPSIYELPASTFEGCSALDGSQGGTFTVGGLVNSLGEYAFKDCTALTAINCTNALTSIGANAFENDEALTSFTMGLDSTGSITIGDEAFKGCEALSDIELPVPTITVGTDTFANALTSALKLRVPLSFLSNVPSGTTYEYAYPGYVTSIAANEFKDNTSITGIEIPESVTTVGDAAFQGCTALTSIALYNAIIGNSMFRGCTALTSIEIPETITTIGTYAFQECTGLTSIVIPDNVTSIGNSIFRGCSGLTSATIGTGVTAIADHAFRGCSSLASIDLQGNVASIGEYGFAECVATSMTFHDGLTSIAASAFRSMTNCATFNFEECTSVPALADVNAFLYTPTTKWIYIPYDLATTWLAANNWSSSTNQINESLGYRYAYDSSTTTLGDAAWQGDTHLFEITVPETITRLGNNLCNNCTRLKKAVFKPSITSSGLSTFGLCSSLEELEVGGDTLTTLALNFAKNCSSLTNITITAPITTIASSGGSTNGVFKGCTALASIDLPETVTSIGGYAFYGCSALLALTIPSAVTTIGVGAFGNLGTTTNLPTITMEGKTQADVQGMTDYPWGLRTGSTVHCSDGDITI